MMQQFPRVVVGRTFAKAYGLAGIRAGAVVGQPETVASLRRVTPPYSLNVCAAVALPAAFGDTAFYDWYLSQVAGIEATALRRAGKGRSRLLEERREFRAGTIRWTGVGRAAALAASGIHVRDRSSDPGCVDCLRITAGVVEHTRKFVTALEWLV